MGMLLQKGRGGGRTLILTPPWDSLRPSYGPGCTKVSRYLIAIFNNHSFARHSKDEIPQKKKLVKSQHFFHSFLFRASVRNPSSRSRSMRRSVKTHQSGDTYSVGDSLVSYSISDQER